MVWKNEKDIHVYRAKFDLKGMLSAYNIYVQLFVIIAHFVKTTISIAILFPVYRSSLEESL